MRKLVLSLGALFAVSAMLLPTAAMAYCHNVCTGKGIQSNCRVVCNQIEVNRDKDAPTFEEWERRGPQNDYNAYTNSRTLPQPASPAFVEDGAFSPASEKAR